MTDNVDYDKDYAVQQANEYRELVRNTRDAVNDLKSALADLEDAQERCGDAMQAISFIREWEGIKEFDEVAGITDDEKDFLENAQYFEDDPFFEPKPKHSGDKTD